MEVAQTQKGSPCKLCRAKGELCHLHGGTPRKESKKWRSRYLQEEKDFQQKWRETYGGSYGKQWYTPVTKEIPFMSYDEWLKQHENSPSPKKSPKRSPKTEKQQWDDMLGTFHSRISPGATQETLPEELHKFSELDKPVLYEVMLRMTREQIHYICSNVRKAHEICKSKLFREEYEKLNPPVRKLFSGKLKKTSEDGLFLRFEDEQKNSLSIARYNNIHSIDISYYSVRSVPEVVGVYINLQQFQGQFYMRLSKINKMLDNIPDEEILKSLGLNWQNKSAKERALEFLSIIDKALGDAWSGINRIKNEVKVKNVTDSMITYP